MRSSEGAYVMIEELCNRFAFFRLVEGGALVLIEIPAEFTDLWLEKLNSLYATREEIEEWRLSTP